MNLFRSQKFKYGSASSVFIALFIAAVILINVFIGYISDRYVLEADMTGSGLFDISGQTIDAISTLEEPVTVIVLDKQNFEYTNSRYSKYMDPKYLDAFPEIMQRYEAASDGKVIIEYIDPYENPSALNQYQDLGDLAASDMIVTSSKRSVLISSLDFFDISTSTDATGSSSSVVDGLVLEQKLTSNILYVTTDILPAARFISGHEEVTMSELSSRLVAGNYSVESLNLSVDSIPDDVTLLIISSPQSDFSGEELQSIDDFLAAGGNLIVFTDANSPALPNLNVYLNEWGIDIQHQVVFDDERCLAGKNAYLVPYVQENDATGDLSSSDKIIVTPYSRPFTALWDEGSEWRTVSPLIVTADSAFAKEIPSDGISSTDTTTYQSGDEQGAFTLGTITVDDNPNTDIVGQVICLPSFMAADSYLTTSTYANSDFFATMFAYLNPNADTVIISTKSYNTTALSVQGWQANVVFWILVVIVPLVFLGLGLIIWLRRKNR